jgi:hypothetical protein
MVVLKARGFLPLRGREDQRRAAWSRRRGNLMPDTWTEEELKRDIAQLRERIARDDRQARSPRKRHAVSYLREMLREREETLAVVRFRSVER